MDMETLAAALAIVTVLVVTAWLALWVFIPEVMEQRAGRRKAAARERARQQQEEERQKAAARERAKQQQEEERQKAAARERARQQEEEERQRAAARERARQQEERKRQKEQEEAAARKRKREQEEQERRRNSSPGKLSVAQALGILGLKEGATEQQIRAAYNRLMKRVHPDVGGSNFFAKQLNEARETLSGAL